MEGFEVRAPFHVLELELGADMLEAALLGREEHLAVGGLERPRDLDLRVHRGPDVHVDRDEVEVMAEPEAMELLDELQGYLCRVLEERVGPWAEEVDPDLLLEGHVYRGREGGDALNGGLHAGAEGSRAEDAGVARVDS